MDIKLEKSELRKRILAQNAVYSPEYIHSADGMIAKSILSMPEYEKAGSIFVFASLPSEIDTAPIIAHALENGKTVSVPLIVGCGEMELRMIRSTDELAPGAYGIPEPPLTAEKLSPKSIDFAVIPCVSCSHSGMRLGRGGGYYDRFLARYCGFSALVCREKNICKAIPSEAHDVPADAVVTEAGVFKCGYCIM